MFHTWSLGCIAAHTVKTKRYKSVQYLGVPRTQIYQCVGLLAVQMHYKEGRTFYEWLAMPGRLHPTAATVHILLSFTIRQTRSESSKELTAGQNELHALLSFS
jgi:hypothetical protein